MRERLVATVERECDRHERYTARLAAVRLGMTGTGGRAGFAGWLRYREEQLESILEGIEQRLAWQEQALVMAIAGGSDRRIRGYLEAWGVWDPDQ